MEKKSLITLVVVIVLLIIAGGGYFVYQKSETQKPTVGEVITPKLTYSTFTSETDPITFIYPEEWIQISPAEIEKAVPAEIKERTNILMYATSPQNMILTVSKTVSNPGETNLKQIVGEIIEQSKKVDPNLKEEYKDIKENEAIIEITYKLQGNIDWSARFKALLYHTSKQDIFYIIQLTLPETLRNVNQEVINTILSSFKITE